jgi:hypothetical protein
MPIELWVDKDRRRICAVVSGDFTFEEILDTITKAVNDPDLMPGYDILSDHTQVGEVLTMGQARKMTAHLKGLSDYFAGSRWAVVTTKPASYGMMRMLSVLVEEVPIHLEVFHSFEDAERWLGQPRALE